jgi:hypothetical protein
VWPPYAQLSETGGVSGDSWLWSSTSDNSLFYSNGSLNDGATTSTLQAPYINQPGQYKVVLTDAYGCKDSSSIVFGYLMCTILPVSELNFTATRNGETVLLKWNTLPETNSKYFLIERSSDEKNWSSIGHIPVGNNSIRNYFFTDSMPYTGVNYYRLKQVDGDGRYSFSDIHSVLMNNERKLNVYPNPVTSLLQVKTNVKLSGVRIMDLSGKIVLNNFTVSSDVIYINVSGLASGIYFIELINSKNERYHSRFIKK